MSLRSIAAAVMLTFYFIAWVLGDLPRESIFVAISAIAALVWAVLLVVPVLDRGTNN